MRAKYSCESEDEDEKALFALERHQRNAAKSHAAVKVSTPYSIPALVVDDEDMNVDIMKELLKAQNYESDLSLNEQKAIQLFKERVQKVKRGEAEMYKIVLLDYSMPGIGGLEVARSFAN